MTWMDFMVRGTLVMVAGFLATWALSRASAALRHFVWTVVFAALVVLPGALRAPKIAIPLVPRLVAGGRGESTAEVHRPARRAGGGCRGLRQRKARGPEAARHNENRQSDTHR